MFVTWTTLRTRLPVRTVPWQPVDATWWQSGHGSTGRAEPPPADGCWWSVLATWDDLGAAQAGPGRRDDLDVWHVVLQAAAFRGEAVLAGGARPFDAAPPTGRVDGAAAVLTLAGLGPDSAREREFFRRFLHASRSVGAAPGNLAVAFQAPADGAVLTLSFWEGLGPALDWAYAQHPHAATVERQRTHRVVEASGFLRCAVLSSSGTLGDLPDPLAGRSGAVVGAETASA